ncbi:two-component system sensor histidine kinase NtrB [Tepidimonas sp.]|uniref:two-component system sensor histidine kinase NtrB n=1 Tax=Tepidimonas sp. TaxID=2002775 RepID=UPI0039A22B74
MRRQQEQARRREKAAALGILVSGVAHELNNPLSNVSTAVQLLMEEGDTADADTRARWLAQIDGETERARRIVRRLLDSVRPPRPSRQAVPLPELFARTLALVERQLPPGVSVCVGAVEEVVLQADRERLQQVLINLIKNAAEAGAQRIVLTAGIAIWDEEAAEGAQLQGDPAGLAQAERAVRILVEDDGCGMPGEVLTHIFEPFYTTRGAGEGTGLGLYLVQEIVAEHGGLILAESTPGRGSRFTVWLPLGAEETA